MRWYHMIGGLALVLLLTMLSLPGLSAAQGAGGLTDFQGKSSRRRSRQGALSRTCSAPVRTRGVGPVQSPSSMAPTETGSDAQCAVRAEFSHGSAGVVRGG